MATDDERRANLYRASLQQFEELLMAAGTIGPAASPLPLYYALNQAGRAVLASREPDESKVFAEREHHGLTVPRETVGEDLLLATVRTARAEDGQFQRVAASVSSPVLRNDTPVPLGALIASLPEAGDEGFDDDAWAIAVRAHPLMRIEPELPTIVGSDEVAMHILFSQGTMQLGLVTDGIASLEDLKVFTSKYPALRDRQVTLPSLDSISPSLLYWPTPAGMALELRVSVQSGGGDLASDHDTALDEIAPEYRWLGRRWLRPSLQAGHVPPTPFMTWWAVLYALSMLARYYPTAWTAALSIDRSVRAALLERTLALALEALPQLVFEAVGLAPRAGPFLLPAGPDTPPLHR